MNEENDRFEEKICRVLDHSLNDLDADTEYKLGRLKYRALSSAVSGKSRRPIWGSAFMAAALLLIVLFNLPQDRQVQLASPDFTELDILTAKESLEFYAEDIEFYQWLSELMENEPAFMGEDPVVPANSHSQNTSGRGENRNTLAQYGVDRISWGFRG